MLLADGLTGWAAGRLDAAFAGHPTRLLFFVMICGPLAMNLIQAWIQDQVLRWRRPPPASGTPAGASDDCAPAPDRPLHACVRRSAAPAAVCERSFGSLQLAGQAWDDAYGSGSSRASKSDHDEQ